MSTYNVTARFDTHSYSIAVMHRDGVGEIFVSNKGRTIDTALDSNDAREAAAALAKAADFLDKSRTNPSLVMDWVRAQFPVGATVKVEGRSNTNEVMGHCVRNGKIYFIFDAGNEIVLSLYPASDYIRSDGGSNV